MNPARFKSQVALGKDSRQFKRDATNADSLAAEMAAFTDPEKRAVAPLAYLEIPA